MELRLSDRTGRGLITGSFRKVLDLAPTFMAGHYYLAKSLLAEGHAQAALASSPREADEASCLEILPIMLQAVGRKADADEALRILSTKFANSVALYVAMGYAFRGDSNLALDWLDRTYRRKDVDIIEIVGEPLFKNRNLPQNALRHFRPLQRA